MNLLQSLVLGIVQGLTEFLPISSSGHLVLVPWLVGWEIDPQAAFIFDVLVQWGTLLAVIVYFRRDLREMLKGVQSSLRSKAIHLEARMAWFLLLSTVPAVVIGLAIKPWVEASIDRPLAVSLFLFLTAGLLILGEQIGKRTRDLTELGAGDAFFMGLLQVLALFPGVSRSGATVSAGLIRHLDRGSSARFSFLMAVPIMLAAGIIALFDLLTAENMTAQIGPLVAGTFAAAIVGYLAIDWLFAFISRHSLRVFAYYCLLVGALGISIVVLRG